MVNIRCTINIAKDGRELNQVLDSSKKALAVLIVVSYGSGVK